MRRRRFNRQTKILIVACAIVGGLAGGWLAKRNSGRACHAAIDAPPPPWRMHWGEEYCIALVDPYLAEPNKQELTASPSLLSDPDKAVRTLQTGVPALDTDVRGVTKVRFQLTGEGIVRNPHVVESSGHAALDEAVVAIATSFEFSPGTTASGPAEVPMEYVIGFEFHSWAWLQSWLPARAGSISARERISHSSFLPGSRRTSTTSQTPG